jgi:hypothetical protein
VSLSISTEKQPFTFSVLASEEAQKCLIETNKQMLRCITKKSREKKLKDALEEVTENNSNQQDIVRINNCM